MQILHILGFYPETGGPYTAIRGLAIALSNRGLKIDILSPFPRDYDINKLYKETPESLNVKYIRESFLSRIFPSFSNEWKTVLENILPRIDLVHVHGFFDHYTYVASKFSRLKPVVISPRGSIMNDAIRLKGNLKKRLYLNCFGINIIRNASAIHLTNQYEKEEFMDVFKRNLDKNTNKIFIAPNGINLKEYINLPPLGSFKQKHTVLKDRKYIVFLSRKDPKKGLDILVESFNKLAAIYDDLYLVVVGPDNKGYGKKVRQWLYNAGLLERSLFIGMLTGRDKLAAILDAEVFVLPSYSENFGIAVLEAMACGTPVVVSNKVGISREIEGSNAGIVVETNPESVFKGVKALLDNDVLSKKVADNGRKLVEEYYDINTVADMMIKTYEEVIRNASGRNL